MPKPAARPRRRFACEVRQVGDKKWRRFASRADAAAAFPGKFESPVISRKLINKPSWLPPLSAASTRREMYGDKSSDSDDAEADDDAAPARKRPRLGLVEVRRVGEEFRRFATRDDAVAAFPELRDRADISELVSRPSKARLAIRGKFEARNVFDEADGEEDSKAEEERPAVRGGPALIGRKVRIWWPHDREWFTGTVGAFDGRLHEVTYDDGSLWDEDLETPGERKWELVGGGRRRRRLAAVAARADAPAARSAWSPLDADAPSLDVRPAAAPSASSAPALDADAFSSLEACGHRLHADCLFGAECCGSCHACVGTTRLHKRGDRASSRVELRWARHHRAMLTLRETVPGSWVTPPCPGGHREAGTGGTFPPCAVRRVSTIPAG